MKIGTLLILALTLFGAGGLMAWQPKTQISSHIYRDQEGQLFTSHQKVYELMSNGSMKEHCLNEPLRLQSNSNGFAETLQLTITGSHSLARCIFTGQCTEWSCVKIPS